VVWPTRLGLIMMVSRIENLLPAAGDVSPPLIASEGHSAPPCQTIGFRAKALRTFKTNGE
jgi:hypothetical protein